MNRTIANLILLVISSLSVFGQTAVDSSITIVKEVTEVEVVQKRSSSFVEQKGNKMMVSTGQLKNMPKFLGTSDPVRYMQSLAGISTNNETATGLHIQGCDGYQTMISINSAPVYYPNHLLGLYSTFIAPHFRNISIEQAEHTGTTGNRIGGDVNFATHSAIPERFGMEGNIGLVNADLTLAVPCGEKNALWISGRSSYIDLLYGRWLKFSGSSVNYHFMDFNLTYSSALTDKDQLVVTGFYSRDGMRIEETGAFNVPVSWQNIVASAYWNRQLDNGNWRTTAYYSSYDNSVEVSADPSYVATAALFSSFGLKNKLQYYLTDDLFLSASLDYDHYYLKPMRFELKGVRIFESESQLPPRDDADELSLGADLQHDVTDWFSYNVGLHTSAYIYQSKPFGGLDPRVTLRFTPVPDHTIALHYGRYHQYFHKAGLTSGGLPTDFFFLATETFRPEVAHALNLRYSTEFLNRQYSLTAELYFKQIYNIVESTSNILDLFNKPFTYEDYVISGNGRNYGLNLMFQRNKGYVTGYVSYTLGWAKRSLSQLEGKTDYIYAASHERRHDLKVVLNSQVAKRWNIGLMFVLASGIPYTKALEAYLVNGRMICHYDTYNGAHIPLYHRLDLSVSYDIIKKNDHELGVNLSLYNAYAHKNAQFVLYRENLHPSYGSTLSTIIPSISIYGKF